MRDCLPVDVLVGVVGVLVLVSVCVCLCVCAYVCEPTQVSVSL